VLNPVSNHGFHDCAQLAYVDHPLGNGHQLGNGSSPHAPARIRWRLLSALTGEESDAELRTLATQFTRACPLNQQQDACPFCTLRHLYYRSLQTLLGGITRTALVGLFELECEVRNQADPESCPLAGGESAEAARPAGPA
jgi:hypothetical protein